MVDLRFVTSTCGGGPIIPDYSGANVRGIIPALLGPGDWATSLPSWMPAPVAASDHCVMLVLDGLGWDQLQDHREIMPTLAGLTGGAIDTVAPTTTSTALTSITTGLTPGEHGIVGYRMVLTGDVLNVLRWTVGEQQVRRSKRPTDVQPFDPFLGRSVPVVSMSELQNSAFSEAHLRGSRQMGWRAASSIAVTAAELVRSGERFVYCYYGGIDKIAHERGFGPYYEAELSAADRLVADVLAALPGGTSLLITADHGQVHVGENIVHPSEQMLRGVTLQSGEGRFRWLHAAPGAVADVAQAAEAEVGEHAWVVTQEQVVDEGWFGPTVSPPVRARLGDVALVAHEPVSFYEEADSGLYQLVCRHGSLTSAEVKVPLLAGIA